MSRSFPVEDMRTPPGAPGGSHIFRALDDLLPEQVRVVVIGQDPYPQVSQGTGRAFEQGNLGRWTSKSPQLVPSLRRIAQQIAVARTGNHCYGAPKGGWHRLKQDIDNNNLDFPGSARSVRPLAVPRRSLAEHRSEFTKYERGSCPHQLKGHIPMWAPIVSGICQCLAMCPDIPVVFLSWGAKADRFLNKADIAPCVQLKTHVIARNHPSTVGFLKKPNVFRHITRGVKAIGKAQCGKTARCV